MEQNNPSSQANIYCFDNLDKALGTYSSYEKPLLIGDLNTETSEPHIDSFVYGHELHNLVKKKTCFKSVENPSYIELILTNNTIVFQDTTAIFTVLSDFHYVVLAVFKTSIAKTSLLKSSIAYFQTFKKRYYEEVLPRNLYFKKTLGTILKKLKKKQKNYFQQTL